MDTLEDFAATRKRVYCQVCTLFARQPELKAEADAGRAKPQPISYNVIAGYLSAKGREGDPKPKVGAVRQHYVDGHDGNGAK